VEGPKSTNLSPDMPQQTLAKSDLTSIRVIMGPVTLSHAYGGIRGAHIFIVSNTRYPAPEVMY
jgi:hypothetical protein